MVVGMVQCDRSVGYVWAKGWVHCGTLIIIKALDYDVRICICVGIGICIRY